MPFIPLTKEEKSQTVGAVHRSALAGRGGGHNQWFIVERYTRPAC